MPIFGAARQRGKDKLRSQARAPMSGPPWLSGCALPTLPNAAALKQVAVFWFGVVVTT
jgi:hypothetical protein